MICDDSVEILVLPHLVNSYQKLIRNCHDSFSLFDWFASADAHDPIGRTPEVWWVSNAWINDHSVLPKPVFVPDVEGRILEL
jgi:hypothetical protein